MKRTCGSGWRRSVGGLLCLVVAGGLVGCASPAGHWAGSELRPEMSRDQFQLLRAAERPGRLVSAELRLQADGSYTAELNYDGRIEQSLGTWRWDATGHLAFVDKAGRTYGYTVRRPNDQTLELVRNIKGTDATLTLMKRS